MRDPLARPRARLSTAALDLEPRVDHSRGASPAGTASTNAATGLKKSPKNGVRLTALADLLVGNPQLRDAYSTLLAGLRLKPARDRCKSILVTSAQPHEGKTTVACHLAIAASLAGESVLLIDGDLRRSRLTSAAGTIGDIGLGEILSGDADLEAALHTVELGEAVRAPGCVSVLGAGRKSSEMLAGIDWTEARSHFQPAARQFGIAVVNSCPVLAANDALLLAGIVDGVLLVVNGTRADRDEVRQAKEQLDLISTPLIGIDLNEFDPKLHGSGYKPYYGECLAAF